MHPLPPPTGSPPHRARRLAVKLSGASLLLGAAVVAPAGAAWGALAVPTAPTNVSAQRSAQNVRNFTVSWTSGTGPISHHAVIVFVDGKRTQQIVPATTTSLLVQGNSLQSIYQVHVASLNAEKQGAVSQEITVNPVLPGPPSDVTGAVGVDGSSISVRWSPPQRAGLNPVQRYEVSFTDVATRQERTFSATGTRFDSPMDAGRVYNVEVTAVTRDGRGLTETSTLGGAVASAPRWFTAVRDPDDPTRAALNWTAPAWSGRDGIVTGYEVGSGTGTVSSWTPVGDVLTTSIPLAASGTAVFSVRARTAGGVSVLAEPASVDTVSKSPIVNSAFPIAASSTGGTVTVTVSDNPAVSFPWLFVWLLPQEGWTYRDMRLLGKSVGKTVSFTDVPSGRYRIMVLGVDVKDLSAAGRTLFNEEIIVNDLAETMNATEASFSEGSSIWHGIYPPTSLPSVVMTDSMSYDGSAAMAVTATANSVGRNITAGAGPARAIPVSAGKQLVVSAQGYATTAPTQWNLGISWWDARGEQISLVRTPRLRKVNGSWKTSGGTFVAPAGAVAASTFVEVGEMLRGQTFYIDDIALRSYVPSQQVQTATDWTAVRGESQLIGGTVSMTSEGETSVLDTSTPGADISVTTQAQLFSGSSYGVQVRASQSSGGLSGYLVELQKTGAAHHVWVRQVTDGKVCNGPLGQATVKAPFDSAASHRLTVRVAGTALGVAVAGQQVLTVANLSTAAITKRCGPAPAGSGVGLSKAADSSVEFTGIVLNRA